MIRDSRGYCTLPRGGVLRRSSVGAIPDSWLIDCEVCEDMLMACQSLGPPMSWIFSFRRTSKERGVDIPFVSGHLPMWLSAPPKLKLAPNSD